MFDFTLYIMNNDDKMRYLWTIRPNISKERIHVVVEFEPIQAQAFSEVHHTYVSTDEDHSNIRQHVMIITQMVSNEPSMLYPNVEEDDDADEDYDVLSESDDDDNPNNEEDDISTPVNPLSSTTVNQWQSSQWFSNAPYDYTSFGTFLDMDLGKQIDDLIESGTIRLLDWNDAIIDLQLGMRLVDKIQAISVFQKWSFGIR
ncbi:hypothetical protein M9H77_05084 [Catharanthus roseus]|uniref:Uncharacterized protein n=1 Tax=Catharanthus roseus TaxID=4058 RepID=A0ACC0CFY1_CATRO|nr:hypothetical protein M9H77_05084 [Catharanthus roseus]